MALQPQSYSRCLCLPLFGSAAKVHIMVVVLVEVVFQNFDLIVIFSGRVGGAQAWEKDGEKEKEAGWRLEERHGSRLC